MARQSSGCTTKEGDCMRISCLNSGSVIVCFIYLLLLSEACCTKRRHGEAYRTLFICFCSSCIAVDFKNKIKNHKCICPTKVSNIGDVWEHTVNRPKCPGTSSIPCKMPLSERHYKLSNIMIKSRREFTIVLFFPFSITNSASEHQSTKSERKGHALI